MDDRRRGSGDRDRSDVAAAPSQGEPGPGRDEARSVAGPPPGDAGPVGPGGSAHAPVPAWEAWLLGGQGTPRKAITAALLVVLGGWGFTLLVGHALRPRSARPTVGGTILAALVIPEPLAREACRPGTPIAADFDAYGRFLEENRLAGAVLVAWIRAVDGSVEYHAIRPLDDPVTHAQYVVHLPELVPGKPRPPGTFRYTRVREWAGDGPWDRRAAEEALGAGELGPGHLLRTPDPR